MQGFDTALKKQITIRKFRYLDIKRVLHIEKTSFVLPWRFQDFLIMNLNSKILFLVAVKDEVIGYAIAELIKGAPHLERQIQGHILNIAVDLNYRKQGIGRKLISSIFEKLRESGVGRVSLEVRLSNNTARDFYKSLGFREEKTLLHYYGDEGAIVMEMGLG